MIIDKVSISGPASYLRAGGSVNLASGGGTSLELDEGVALQVDGLNLQFDAASNPPDSGSPPGAGNLLTLYSWSATPLLSVSVVKEMFPGLFRDPYAHRVHNIAGFEDLRRGVSRNLQVMEVDGQPTLVSIGDDSCEWTSAIYPMPPSLQVSLTAAAWDLATSRLTPSDGFAYQLWLRVWHTGQAFSEPPEQIKLTVGVPPAANALPGDFRWNGGLAAADVKAYQVYFKADVRHDAYLRERQTGPPGAAPLGRPLLRAINLLEPVESIHNYHSLAELVNNSTQCELFDYMGAPPRKLLARLDLTAVLTQKESILLKVPPGMFSNVEARLDATLLIRPPMVDKEP